MKARTRLWVLSWLMALFLGTPYEAIAADINTLGYVLSPAYLAMDFTMVCERQDPAFISATNGPRGSALAFAQHTKSEVISNLDNREAQAVVRIAADAARVIALGMLRSMRGGSASIEAGRVLSWCETVAKPFVRGTVAEHEKGHDLFEKVIEGAKRS